MPGKTEEIEKHEPEVSEKSLSIIFTGGFSNALAAAHEDIGEVKSIDVLLDGIHSGSAGVFRGVAAGNPCNNIYHLGCIVLWLVQRNSCLVFHQELSP